ncbi:class II aldolase/adducin family protein [Alicyclobacillus fastidiosus]|uniref:Class II aldolase/adducin family protein n=1 Tax=Alicyclobacillus fastidiosus TaxID=392011 RepID=A0ABY6ZFI9_9BACL|nr:class II aldolase/adducin family protein [Alicyclobacillus fastidiosus]WAH41619.1 class II aldolase/adducin family protein [Alicyclobacillus fastidiosus]GMA63285.1 hypothetical protein GCM10025859_37250 [Alicyclobacillus fastidiosus]
MSDEMANRKLSLVKAIRMMERVDLLDMNGHISCRLAEGDSRFLINARAASRATLTTSDVVVCNADGTPEPGGPEPPSEVYIHTEIYRQRPDVYAIVHNHPHWQTVLGIADLPLKPVFSIGSFSQFVPYYERSSLVNEREMGEELARALAGHRAIQIRHHGSVVVGGSVEEVFATAVFMEENAKKQYQTYLVNRNHHVLEGENLKRTQETNWSPKIVRKVWTYHEEKSLISGHLNGLQAHER